MQRFALIPAYKPTPDLLDIVLTLSNQPFDGIIVIDDGGGEPYKTIFETLRKVEKVTILVHVINRGKGAALKTGINHICNTYGDHVGIVTVDADGQHRVEDAVLVADALDASPDSLILGARSFSGEVPLRSRFGNALTRFLFKLVHSMALTDTQTGLRGTRSGHAKSFLTIRSQRYDFELDMLIMTKRLGLPIVEVPIETIYIDDNQSSHFNPIFDSVKIYFSVFRFALAGLVAAIIDNLIFIILFSIGWPLFASQTVSRTMASIVNYRMVHGMVFHSKERHLSAVPKYVATVIILGLVSYGLIIFAADYLATPVIPTKIAVEALIFIASFLIQKVFIFKEGAR